MINVVVLGVNMTRRLLWTDGLDAVSIRNLRANWPGARTLEATSALRAKWCDWQNVIVLPSGSLTSVTELSLNF